MKFQVKFQNFEIFVIFFNKIVNLNLQLLLRTSREFKHKLFLFKSFLYLLQLCEFDQEILLRDRARLLKNLLLMNFEGKGEKNPEYDETYKNIYNYSEEKFEAFLQKLQEHKLSLSQDFLLTSMKASLVKFNEEEFANKFRMGSLSNLVDFSLKKQFF